MISDSSLRKAISRRVLLQRLGFAAAGLAALSACNSGREEEGATTLDRTIALGSDGSLLSAPGEPYAVRTDLAEAQGGRPDRRVSLIAFHHLSDFRITDEESPARAEWQSQCPSPNAESFRPQETLSVQAAEALIGQANAISKSPATGRAVDFAIHTGNAADNAQFNELRWFIDMMDGRPVYPDSGAIGYQGVQTGSPNPNYGDLLNDAQRQFTPVALAYPWYAVLGNRDILAQGTAVPNERANRIATGAQKITELGPDALAEACSGAEVILGPDSSPTILNDPGTRLRSVGKDANRRFLSRIDWLTEHFGTADAPGPAGHGFSPDNVANGTAYYSFDRGPIAVIVLDTVNGAGRANGSIGEAQFLWLEQELIARSGSYSDATGATVQTGNPDRLIIIATNHSSDTLNNPFPGPIADETRYRAAELEALLHRFPNVVLHIAGHTLEHRVIPHAASDRNEGYWEITTGSPSFWPSQGRLVEIVDNRDGTLSVLSTVYDAAAPITPGDARDPTPDDGQNQRLLAAVARGISARDPLRDDNARGLAASDRNAELLLHAPLDTSSLPSAR